MEKKRDEKCDPCERMFEKGIERTVNRVEGYTPKKRDTKRREAEDAFGEHEDE